MHDRPSGSSLSGAISGCWLHSATECPGPPTARLARRLIWLLAMGMILSARDAASAAPPEPRAAKTSQAVVPQRDCGPWFVLSWSPPPDDCTNLTPFYWIRTELRDSSGRILDTATDPVRAALASQKLPPGRATLFFWNVYRNPDLLSNPEDHCLTPEGVPTDQPGVWPDHGIQTMRRRVDAFMSAFKQAGGKLDYLILDFEGSYSMWSRDPRWFLAIQNDPRSAPLKKQLGFSDFSDLANTANRKYLAWNAELRRSVCDAIRRGMFDVVRQYFPNAVCSNFNSYVMTKEHVVPDLNGHPTWFPVFVGQAMTNEFYGYYRHLARQELDGKQPYGLSTMGVLRWHINTLRAIRQSDPAPFLPWISRKRFDLSLLRNNDGYQELLYHVLLHSSNAVLYWNPRSRDQQSSDDDQQDQLVNALVAEVNRLVGQRTGKTALLHPIPWDCPILASGLDLPQETLWRVTAFTRTSDRCQPIRGAVVDGDYVIAHAGWKLILKDAHLMQQGEPLSSLGQWIRTPAGARPVVTVVPEQDSLHPLQK